MAEPVPGIPDAFTQAVDYLPAELDDAVPAGWGAYARPGSMLLAVEGVGRFLIENGRSIRYTPQEGGDPERLRLFLYGTARGALIHQRGELPLHAATLVAPDGSTLAICGKSGAGKSTLAAALTRRGWSLLADDVTRITWDGTEILAWPGNGRIKLWRDACDAFGLNVAGLEPVAQGVDKHFFAVTSHDTPAPLDAILELTEDETNFSLSPGEKMGLVSRHTYRGSFVTPLGMQAAHVRMVARTVGTARILRMIGKNRYMPAELAEALERALF